MNIEMEQPNSKELAYIAAMSRESVVDAYSAWTSISEAEKKCISAVGDGVRILDLGCGAGRFAKLLENKATLYLGIDASKEMVQAARQKHSSASFLVCDIADYKSDNTWDVILLMGNVLDYLQPVSRRITILNRCKGWLNQGGKIIGSSHLTKSGQVKGYYSEDYHGALVENYRASLAEIIAETESVGFEVVFGCRDYRAGRADWCYWVAQMPT